MIMAISGKGGVGKTFITAILTKILSKRFRLLSIDADPSQGLSFALCIEPKRTIWEIREMMKEKKEREKLFGKEDIPLKDVIKREALISRDGFDFLVMGRSEGPGCFCSLNELLRYAIESLSKEYEVVLIDCEAGIEQVKRRVLKDVDSLFIVSDPTVRGVQTAKNIASSASSLSEKKLNIGLIFNMVEDMEKTKSLLKELVIPVLAYVPADPNVKRFDLEGRSLLEFPEDSPSFRAIYTFAEKMILGYGNF